MISKWIALIPAGEVVRDIGPLVTELIVQIEKKLLVIEMPMFLVLIFLNLLHVAGGKKYIYLA